MKEDTPYSSKGGLVKASKLPLPKYFIAEFPKLEYCRLRGKIIWPVAAAVGFDNSSPFDRVKYFIKIQ